ncbi:MAG: YlxR family protein [Chloroflexi bacterium]|nr:YlxR family protein [Chloroflexota bacterium]MBP8057402.1 YlxR family protein [Chloroflexota bacterium]
MSGKKAQPTRPRHVPQRTCVICRAKTDKRRLMRIVRTPEQIISLDPTGKKNGRGAYVCDNPDCWVKMQSTQLLDRALEISIPQETKTALAEQRLALSSL